MKIIVLADEVKKEEFKQRKLNSDTQINFIEDISEIDSKTEADAFFILNEDSLKIDLSAWKDKPIFINSTTHTSKELNLPKNVVRINGWSTFLNREVWEVATIQEGFASHILKKLNWKYIVVADEPGLVAARIISMIINEAYFALGDDVSSKEEIDLAMKLGTNYPYGPFEWCEKIGLKNIYHLLKKLSKEDSRYNVAPAMEKEFNQWH